MPALIAPILYLIAGIGTWTGVSHYVDAKMNPPSAMDGILPSTSGVMKIVALAAVAFFGWTVWKGIGKKKRGRK